MLADNDLAPSASCTHPASAAYSDDVPPAGPTTRPDERGDDRIGDSVPPDEAPAPGPATAPGDDRGRLARLGDRIAELSARIQAATYELLVLIREFDERGGWDGCLSCAQWLSWRAGLAPGAAREHVRVARALGKLPKLSEAMRRGRISYSKVRAVTRVATPDNEDNLLYVCQAGTAAHVERIARAWRRIDRNAEQAEDRLRSAGRELRTWVDEDGMVVVRGRLTPEVGAALRRALEAACDQARRAPASEGGGDEKAPDASADREGEAVGGSAGAAADVEEPTFAQRQADAIGTVAEAALAGGLDRGTAGDRYQVVLHVDAEALAAPPDVPAGMSGGAAAGSEQGTSCDRVPAGTSASAVSGPDHGLRVAALPWERPRRPRPGRHPRRLTIVFRRKRPRRTAPATGRSRRRRGRVATLTRRRAVAAPRRRPMGQDTAGNGDGAVRTGRVRGRDRRRSHPPRRQPNPPPPPPASAGPAPSRARTASRRPRPPRLPPAARPFWTRPAAFASRRRPPGAWPATPPR